MTEIVLPGQRSGFVTAPPSKSHSHRLLICAALSDSPSVLENFAHSGDIDATMSVLCTLGTEFLEADGKLTVMPIRSIPTGPLALDVSESGSTLRFLLPILGALGISAEITMHGRLAKRPIEPLLHALTAHGMTVSQSSDLLLCSGRLTAGTYDLPGDVSSQFVSGLLFALPLLDGDSAIRLTSPLQSAQYVTMTLDALKQSGIEVDIKQNAFHICGRKTYHLPPASIEGDWSAAANFLAAGAFSAKGITVGGLNADSTQPDRQILNLLREFGAEVDIKSFLTIRAASLHGTVIDASQFPDLVPVLAVLGTAVGGETHIVNAARLRLKESDRLAATAAMLQSLGGRVEELPDGLRIFGVGSLSGGDVPPSGDHRIVMAAAIAASVCRAPVIIPDAECVEKSYPTFFRDLNDLKGAAL